MGSQKDVDELFATRETNFGLPAIRRDSEEAVNSKAYKVYCPFQHPLNRL